VLFTDIRTLPLLCYKHEMLQGFRDCYMSLKMTSFWDVASCGLVEVDKALRGAYCLHQNGPDDFFNETTRRYIPYSCLFHIRRRENLKSHILLVIFHVLSKIIIFNWKFRLWDEPFRLWPVATVCRVTWISGNFYNCYNLLQLLRTRELETKR
jgi:hypothetical protein